MFETLFNSRRVLECASPLALLGISRQCPVSENVGNKAAATISPRRSATGIVGVAVAQLFGDVICLVRLPGATIGIGRFVKCARSDGRVVVEQRDPGISFARVVKSLPFELNIALQ